MVQLTVISGDYGSFYDNYIFMSFVEGQSLNKTWETYDSVTKGRVANQLKGYFDELRQIDHSGYIGSVGRGPVADPILEDSETKEIIVCSPMEMFVSSISWSTMGTSLES
ncbi:hypothetical protein ASPNIDRAFT_127766 [Aspergillus niger ATCC 1015]|uniref:Uncharacterized protein n=1 Tax=Aspergillus niger (strain ATCC 1015 / CBS 113.46 / FGSC A1144 / LSHB Ac4 / NCTC 3858a / NRRL 328 / USDA 3528.7) TaxID=380704 RepID=G3XYN3_ASPNA|nr:hypothetical protein ASPNIDRAFT_127766 [Aspergillus niger ATCC 1015]